MPKYGIHQIILNETISKLQNDNSEIFQDMGNEMRNNSSTAMLGAVGPDLFFWASDYKTINYTWKLYENIQKIITDYHAIIKPITEIKNGIGEISENLVDSFDSDLITLIKHSIDKVNDLKNTFQSTIRMGLFLGVTNVTDAVSGAIGYPKVSTSFFNSFKPNLQNSEDTWYWFDMLHYRNTGEFAKNLIKNSDTAEKRSFSYGYMSHIATDLIGHSFVNQIVGGPFRLHPQRHVTVENFMDTRMFEDCYEENINSSLKTRLNLPQSMSDDIRDLLYDAFNETYDIIPHPTFLSKNDISETLDIFNTVLEMMANMNVPRPQEPFSDVVDILRDSFRDIFQQPPSPPSNRGSCGIMDIMSLGITENSRECYESAFEVMTDWAKYISELGDWLFERVTALIDFILTALLALPVTTLLAALYAIELLCYDIYKYFKSSLALFGFVYPDPDNIFTSHGRNLTTTFQSIYDVNENQNIKKSYVNSSYPRIVDSNNSHLMFPNNGLELPPTCVDFYPSSEDITPHNFMFYTPFDLSALKFYANLDSPRDLLNIQMNTKPIIGNALDLTTWMIKNAHNDEEKNVVYTNWNLDSDRGYGYKIWNGETPSNEYVWENIKYV